VRSASGRAGHAAQATTPARIVYWRRAGTIKRSRANGGVIHRMPFCNTQDAAPLVSAIATSGHIIITARPQIVGRCRGGCQAAGVDGRERSSVGLADDPPFRCSRERFEP